MSDSVQSLRSKVVQLTKERDEVVRTNKRLCVILEVAESFHRVAVKERDLERVKVDRLTDEVERLRAALDGKRES